MSVGVVRMDSKTGALCLWYGNYCLGEENAVYVSVCVCEDESLCVLVYVFEYVCVVVYFVYHVYESIHR